MNIKLEVNGEPVEVDISFDSLTLRESVLVEQALGGDVFDDITQGKGLARPSVIRALLYAKLKGRFPDLSLDGFDLDLGALDMESPAPNS